MESRFARNLFYTLPPPTRLQISGLGWHRIINRRVSGHSQRQSRYVSHFLSTLCPNCSHICVTDRRTDIRIFLLSVSSLWDTSPHQLRWDNKKLVKPYKCFQSQGHLKKKRPIVAASLMLVACLIVEIIQN